VNAGRLASINVSPGGVPKRPVPQAQIEGLGLVGDGHRDLEHHGGPERAVCLFSLERIRALAAEGHAIGPGAIGENLTVEGLDWSRVGPGRRVLVGDEVLLEVTRYTSPCATIAAVFRGGDYARVSQRRHPGDSRVYARVLQTGLVRTGDPVRLLDPR
jgi:MOSC domain-containing protein YiiM